MKRTAGRVQAEGVSQAFSELHAHRRLKGFLIYLLVTKIDFATLHQPELSATLNPTRLPFFQ